MTDYTVDELICTCISRQIVDGEMVAQGLATPLVASGYLLAKLTHAPHIAFASVVGNCLCLEGGALALGRAEEVWIAKSRRFVSFGDVVCGVLPALHPREFFRPAQVDARGNTNNVAFGDPRRPRFRLPGAGGLPDLTGVSPSVCFYVPRHGRATFVAELDFRSGVGVLDATERAAAGTTGPGPRYLVSDLGCFDFAPGHMRLVSYHAGIAPEAIQAKTGFPLAIAPDAVQTPPPSAEEIRLLREVVDPLGIRTLEVLSGADRWSKLREIAQRETRA